MLESASELYTEKSRVRMRSRVGVLITTDISLLLRLAASSLCKEQFVCSRMRNLVYFVQPSREGGAEELPNLIVVPTVLLSVWSEHLSRVPEARVRCVRSSKEMDELPLEAGESLLLADTILKNCRSQMVQRQFGKAIICNSTNLKTADPIRAHFYWFVHPSIAQAHPLKQLPANWQEVVTIRFLPPLPERHHIMEDIFSEVPIENITLKGLVDEVVMSHLDSNDITRALQCISHKNVRTHRDVVHHVLRDFNERIAHIEAKIYSISCMEYVCPEERGGRILALQKKRDEVQRRREELSNRLNKEESCFICYQPVSNPCIMKCCSKRSCFECIHTWFRHSARCPMCNEQTAEVFVLNDHHFLPKQSYEVFHRLLTKFENLYVLLNRLREERAKCVLVCTSNADQLRQIKQVIDKCEARNLVLRRNFATRMIKSGFFVVLQNMTNFPYPIPLGEPVTELVFFDDRTFEHIELLVREHAAPDPPRVWRMRYITQSAYDSPSRSA